MSRKGFTIIEAAVSLVLLSVGASALGAVLLRASRTAAAASATVQATALINSEVSRLNALPFDLMTTGTTCVTVSTPPYPHTRCTTVNSLSSKVHEVIVIVTPSGNSLMRPDTVKFRRSKSSGNNALNTIP
ncbi:MAG TPA: prepilin-type N-terminal cleavage/methylation domain-containing protein [Gemmatimonadales bacterium]|jgi:Tfp pilus assembly protein PilV